MSSGKLTVSPGDRYGRLVVFREVESVVTPNGTVNRRVVCGCDCGRIGTYRLAKLRSGNTQSCGCLAHEAAVERGHRYGGNGRKHGLSGTPEYNSWSGMKRRCENPEDSGYRHYGARGIKVCERWRESFEAFLEDMGPRPSPKHSIDRINNSLGYSAENCKWSTAKEQARNTRKNVLVEHDGETLCIGEWAERYGILVGLLNGRLKSGWSFENAVLTAVRWGDSGFYGTPIAKRDAGWYREYARREAESKS